VTLGDLLAAAERESARAEIASLVDGLSVLTRVAAAAVQEGIDPDTYVAMAVRRFEREASDEEWMGLVSVASRAADPGKAGLSFVVRSVVERDAPRTENA
jgi:hypothetical protein